MTKSVELLIVGAGPAGLSAAVRAHELGMRVLLADDQPAPGGQIWRAIERRATKHFDAEDRKGLELVRRFRSLAIDYSPSTEVWQIEPGFQVFLRSSGTLSKVQANAVLLACGAMERPAPFPGWTLPGVITVGAGQIMLKSANQIPQEPVWIAGSGPLALLYATQLLKAGGRIAGMLDTTPPNRNVWPTPAAALSATSDILRGLGWLKTIRRAGIPIFRGVHDLRAEGDEKLSRITFVDADNKHYAEDARLLMIHEGVVPRGHIASALGSEMVWNDDAASFAPKIDAWGETSVAGLFVAGDGAGIAGAAAACVSGKVAALGVAQMLNKGRKEDIQAERQRLAKEWNRLVALRSFLDRRYRPASAPIDDDMMVCRCENVTAGELRDAVRGGAAGVNQVKAYTRCGMGPCQGRQCGYPAARIVSEQLNSTVAETGLFRVRPPYRPITMGELASIEDEG